ncbi:hypothetical protein HN51_014858 [Arachis hypogaea]
MTKKKKVTDSNRSPNAKKVTSPKGKKVTNDETHVTSNSPKDRKKKEYNKVRRSSKLQQQARKHVGNSITSQTPVDIGDDGDEDHHEHQMHAQDAEEADSAPQVENQETIVAPDPQPQANLVQEENHNPAVTTQNVAPTGSGQLEGDVKERKMRIRRSTGFRPPG